MRRKAGNVGGFSFGCVVHLGNTEGQTPEGGGNQVV